jgi:hypothetical protein
MTAKERRIIKAISEGFNPMIIKGENLDRFFVTERIDDHGAAGYICSSTDTYESTWKFADIQTGKHGERYFVADEIRFNLAKLREPEISIAELKSYLKRCREIVEGLKRDEFNQFAIDNLNDIYRQINFIELYINSKERDKQCTE